MTKSKDNIVHPNLRDIVSTIAEIQKIQPFRPPLATDRNREESLFIIRQIGTYLDPKLYDILTPTSNWVLKYAGVVGWQDKKAPPTGKLSVRDVVEAYAKLKERPKIDRSNDIKWWQEFGRVEADSYQNTAVVLDYVMRNINKLPSDILKQLHKDGYYAITYRNVASILSIAKGVFNWLKTYCNVSIEEDTDYKGEVNEGKH